MPSIDEATFLAIISDYDLLNPSQFEEARNTLNILKESADAEDTSTFDASGSCRGGPLINAAEHNSDSDRGSNKSLPEWSSNTDDTSLSQGMSSLDLEGYDDTDGDAADKTYIAGLEDLDEQSKVVLLTGIFSGLKPFDITWTLKKCNGKVNDAIDHLMTEAFLEENGARQRGIEAFSESDLPLRPRKGKGKKRKGHGAISPMDSPSLESPLNSPLTSKWDTAKQDIDFISTRTGVPIPQVKSMYHNNKASLRDTIAAIVDAHLALELDLDDPIIESKAIDLAHEFPGVPASKLSAIIQITHPSEAYAHELAKALSPRPSTKPAIDIQFRHAPVQLSAPSPIAKPRTYNAVQPTDSSVSDTAARADELLQKRDAAFQKASQMYRKGKSDHLMGGAAAYYSQQGRDADILARRALSEAADVQVASQSTRYQLDLHGCNVNDAKRITQEWVRVWWHELGTERAGAASGAVKSAYGNSLKVITGKGNHSEGRAGKLGPAVGKMLMREGWKIEVTPGYIVVHGVVTKR